VPRFNRTFCYVDVAINDLEVRQSPVVEQARPSFAPMVTSDPKERNSMIYIGVLPESSACLAAAPPLQATQECCLAVRCVPELPGTDAGTMPYRIFVWPRIPEVPVPTELVNGLSADAAKARTQAVCSLAVRSRRRSEC
jgi:hypothetical protein